MKKILSAVALLVSLSFLPAKKQAPAGPAEIKVGALLSLTGNWSSLGLTSQEALKVALQEINSRMEQTGSRYRFSLTVYDTKLDTSLAMSAIREAYRNNIRYIVGPQSSAEVNAVRPFANTNGVLVVSQGSTAGSLAIPGDAVFRFCPSDAVEGDAMAQAIYGSGLRSLILLTRDDAGNKELQQAVAAAFRSRGGAVETLPPWSAATSDFSLVLASLKNKIRQQTTQFGTGKVGVYLASFDGAKDLFRQAAADPVNSSVRWFGGDGLALSSALLSDARASSFAASVQFFAPGLRLPQPAHPGLTAVMGAIKNKTGLEADAYALAAYDALWVIARAVSAFPEPPGDFDTVKDVFQKEAAQYYGLTGPIHLNAAGDRSFGAFNYWGIVNEGGSYIWKWVGQSL